MVPWWKRLLYSFMSWVIAALLSGPLFVIAELVGSHPSRAITALELAASLAVITGMVFLFSLPGWLLAIPIVLAVRRVDGLRFWMYFALGIGIGPLTFLGMQLYFALASHAAFVPGPIEFYLRPAAVSSLTTLIYLLLLRGAQAAGAKKSAAESRAESMHY
jgi:hypothetical protein